MRIARVPLDGEERILCFSTAVVEEATEKYGSLDAYFKALSEGDETSVIRTVIWSVAHMTAAGEEYARLKGIPCAPAMSENEIRYLCDISELFALRAKVQETITSGSDREVEADPPKNVGTTRGQQKQKT